MCLGDKTCTMSSVVRCVAPGRTQSANRHNKLHKGGRRPHKRHKEICAAWDRNKGLWRRAFLRATHARRTPIRGKRWRFLPHGFGIANVVATIAASPARRGLPPSGTNCRDACQRWRRARRAGHQRAKMQRACRARTAMATIQLLWLNNVHTRSRTWVVAATTRCPNH